MLGILMTGIGKTFVIFPMGRNGEGQNPNQPFIMKLCESKNSKERTMALPSRKLAMPN
jgi:hypothetical protein